MSHDYEANDEGYEEALEEGADEGYEEAAPRRTAFRPMSRPTLPSLRPPQPAQAMAQYVTREQLKSVTDKVALAFKTTNGAVGKLDARTQRLGREQGRLETGLRKEISDRKKEICAVRKDLQSTREMSAVLPLLSNLGGGGANSLATFAPLLLLGNDVSCEGGQGNGGLFGGMGGNSTLGLVAILALSGALK